MTTNNENLKVLEGAEVPFERKTRILKSNISKTMQQLHRMWKKGELNFDLAIQRGEVWTPEQKTKLIYSILYGYYIPPVIAEFRKDDKNIYFLDGKQRLTTIMKFIDGAFQLSKNMENVYEHNFAGHKFKDLPEDARNIILEESIGIVKMEYMTEQERDTQFVFLNMGSELTQMEKTRAMYSELIENINVISENQFFADDMMLTDKAKTRFVHQEIILQIAMLVEDGLEKLKGFGSAHIRDYVLRLKESKQVFSNKLMKDLDETLNYMSMSVSNFSDVDRRQALKKTHIPIIFYVAQEARKVKMKPELFGKFIRTFLIDQYSTESKYGMSCQAGSPKKENVIIRINEMSSAFDEYMKLLKDVKSTDDAVLKLKESIGEKIEIQKEESKLEKVVEIEKELSQVVGESVVEKVDSTIKDALKSETQKEEQPKEKLVKKGVVSANPTIKKAVKSNKKEEVVVK